MTNLKLNPLLQPVAKTITIPGSKSYTNRALILAALTHGEVIIHNPLLSDDTKAMIKCLNKLGIRTRSLKNKISVTGNISDVKDKKYLLNSDLSGTTIRFVLALCAIIPGIKILKGKDGLNRRPIKELVDGLKQLGAEIDYLEKDGFPPLKIKSSELTGQMTRLNGGISSQYFTALLMIAPIFGGLTVNVTDSQISKPYIDMTIDTMSKFGVKVINKKYKQYIVPKNQVYKLNKYTVEGDLSSAGYFFAIAALTKSTITLKNINIKSKQADLEFAKILEKMGNKITSDENQMTIVGKQIKPLKVNMENCPDQVQTLAVLTAFADGKTEISGVRSLRVKETERVKALENELAKIGIKTESTNDTLTIYGGNPKPAVIDTYGDHRMAMSFAVAGTKLNGMIINNPEVVSKTFPDFWKKLKEIGVGVQIK